jgi:hypothetical protein
MSSKNNVNPDHYKVAGRDRPDAIAAERAERAKARGTPAPGGKKGRRPANFIPGAAPTGESAEAARPGGD